MEERFQQELKIQKERSERLKLEVELSECNEYVKTLEKQIEQLNLERQSLELELANFNAILTVFMTNNDL